MKRIVQTLKKLLRDERGDGDGYIDTAVFILVMSFCCIFGLSVFTATNSKTNAQNLANIAARQISAAGAVDGETVKSLLKVAGDGTFVLSVRSADDPDLSVDVPISSAQESMPATYIQYGTSFTVSVSKAMDEAIGIGGVHTESTPIRSSAGGISGVWRK